MNLDTAQLDRACGKRLAHAHRPRRARLPRRPRRPHRGGGRGGRDADTVAAIAGGLLGAGHGASAVPEPWRLVLHGWPGLTAPDLITLATAIAQGSR